MLQPYIGSTTTILSDDEELQEFPVFVGLGKGTSSTELDPLM